MTWRCETLYIIYLLTMHVFSTSCLIGNHLSYFICSLQKYYFYFLSNRVYKQHQNIYSLLRIWSKWSFSSFIIVSVEIFQRHCVWVFWSKILWKQYWYIASKEMYGKTTRAQKDCSYGNLAYIQQMTAALGAFILWWWSQDKSKCLLSFYKGLIIYILKTVLMSLMCL